MLILMLETEELLYKERYSIERTNDVRLDTFRTLLNLYWD